MRENDLQKLREMIKDIDFCMMTTVDEDGDLHSRPMSVNGEVDRDGDLWFFTGASSHKVSEIATLKDQVTVVVDDAKRARALHLLFA
jgi:general stress protein 26